MRSSAIFAMKKTAQTVAKCLVKSPDFRFAQVVHGC